MVAGGVTFAVPGAVPEAAAQSSNPNLYVSAENSMFNNVFSGLNVVEVVVRDPDRTIRSGSDIAAEPRVEVDGDQLRMVQGNDGSWYGYFAENASIVAIDNNPNNAIDYGMKCEPAGIPTDAFASEFEMCAANGKHPVIRTSKAINNADGPANLGSIGLTNANQWPFIQVYDFDDESDIVVEYQKGGDAQSVTLYYDSDPDEYGTGLELGRDRYPLGGGVIMTMTDLAMNVDPTDSDTWTFVTSGDDKEAYYYLFDDDGFCQPGMPGAIDRDGPDDKGLEGIDDNLYLTIDPAKDGSMVLDFVVPHKGSQWNEDANGNACDSSSRAMKLINDRNANMVTFIEGDPGVFMNTNSDTDLPNTVVSTTAARGNTAVVDHNDSEMSVVVGHASATITLDDDAVGGVWNSGEEIPVTLTDADVNRKTMNDEDITVSDPEFTIIPSVKIGSPITLERATSAMVGGIKLEGDNGKFAVDSFSDIARLTLSTTGDNTVTFKTKTTGDVLKNFLANDTNNKAYDSSGREIGVKYSNAAFQFLNFDVRSIGKLQSVSLNATGLQSPITIKDYGNYTNNQKDKDLVDITHIDVSSISDESAVDILLKFGESLKSNMTYPVVVDFFSFGQMGDGIAPGDRINNAIYRLELEESGDNTGVFEGTMEYTMLNQLNVRDRDTYRGIDPISDGIVMIVHNDLTDEDSIRINYLDLGADGVSTQVADQIEAPTTSGTVSFDANNYKVADTVTVTLEDADLNTAVETIEIYTVVDDIGDPAYDMVGEPRYGFNSAREAFGRVLDITFDDQQWLNGCGIGDKNNGLGSTGFTLIETGSDTGVFTGNFQIPSQYCHRTGNTAEARSTTGVDMEVNYVDYRDASGEVIEVGDSAGIRASTGTVSLDRTVYPVPFGLPSESPSYFPIHATGILNNQLVPGTYIPNGDLTIHVRINDPDFDESASGEDTIETTVDRDTSKMHGPIKVSISRGADAVVIATAGGPEDNKGGVITAGTDIKRTANKSEVVFQSDGTPVRMITEMPQTREIGPITEIAPDAGIFELDLPIRYTDGPASSQCPETVSFEPLVGEKISEADRKAESALTRFDDRQTRHCILQGDILTVEYTDPTDASGNPNTVTDSATFDLRNGVLQSDKSVYIIGSDMILTLIEPDLDLESDEAETYDLDLIEWDSDAAALTMGNLGGGAAFDPEPSDLRETGDSTGIFQVVVEIPEELRGDRVERGEAIELEYVDYGPSGADYVGDDTEDVNLNIFTSNFGATIELDQKVYTWTDKVYITIVAPDHNFDSDLVDEIGETGSDPLRISTRNAELDPYRLVETGTDTGIFAGEVILTGFRHDADGDPTTGNNGFDVDSTPASGGGPTDGKLPTSDDDGITVSYEFSEDDTVLATALVRWNIGEVQWIETSYPAQGTGIVRVIDPDMNLDPESVNNFDVDVYSDSDSGGISLTVTETNEATGVFEGTVFFTTTDESSGHRLRVSEGDTITAEYKDGTLPNPYSTNDDIEITATSIIGTIVPPLERAPVSNARVVDSLGNSLTSVSVDQQVQITADVINGQDRTQKFAYLVQIQDANGVTVSLSWIVGTLNPGQSLSPSQSWTPDAPGAYTATVFVWESVDNPTALSPPGTVNVNVK